MKNTITTIIITGSLATAACAQTKDVPEAVKQALNEKFANATNVKWDQEEENEWEAEFRQNNIEYSASFDNTGTWLETEHKIDKQRLPSAVVNKLSEKYHDYDIEEAELIDSSENGLAYELEIEVSDQDKVVVIDKSGKIIKEENGEND